MAERARRRTFGPVVLLGLASAGARRRRRQPDLGGRRRRRIRGRDGAYAPARRSPSNARPRCRSPARSRWWCSPAGACCSSPAAGYAAWWPSRRRCVGGRHASWRPCVGLRRRLPDCAARHFAELGVPRTSSTAPRLVLGRLAVGVVLSVVAAVLAVRLAPGWPEMGSRYDAPGRRPPPADPEDQTSLDLWRAIDEGRDPTLRTTGRSLTPSTDPARTARRRGARMAATTATLPPPGPPSRSRCSGSSSAASP